MVGDQARALQYDVELGLADAPDTPTAPDRGA